MQQVGDLMVLIAVFIWFLKCQSHLKKLMLASIGNDDCHVVCMDVYISFFLSFISIHVSSKEYLCWPHTLLYITLL
ncbi:hypothetical protein HanXRQr2_Chr11g0487461 [Helianthus annuus]|uniref:Uncharacterized protein n=1 Tax=Helianthus annuus TaxID=4232 RepID=A0A9K3N088_HELAN|nr:hypothetical protein HanXRQr2_Chr11g0487461 [Helianthus annuus]KAJ0874884.1 hypothetical protein HanPSC8_Chr11g0469641 [Helianthus annuus]